MAESYTRSANLRALMLKPECPEVVRSCAPIFKKLVDPERRSTLFMDIHTLSSRLEDDEDDDDTIVTAWNDRTAQTIPMKLIQGLPHVQLPNKAQFLSSITINGLRYTVSSKHQGNACVLFKSSDSAQVVAAQIEFILQVQVSDSIQTLIIIRQHLAANISHDPCLPFPVLRAKFYSAELDHLEIINAAQITSHYAFFPCRYEDKDLILTMSLSRVSPPTLPFDGLSVGLPRDYQQDPDLSSYLSALSI
jgi:hypothetical protein